MRGLLQLIKILLKINKGFKRKGIFSNLIKLRKNDWNFQIAWKSLRDCWIFSKGGIICWIKIWFLFCEIKVWKNIGEFSFWIDLSIKTQDYDAILIGVKAVKR